jgi:hypothetical protein
MERIVPIDRPWGREYPIPTDDGSELFFPSVNTILGIKNKPALNRHRETLGTVAADAWAETTRDWGSQVHSIIERVNHGECITGDEFNGYPPQVRNCCFAYDRWRESVGFKVQHAECTVFSLTYRYAGTLDLHGRARIPRKAIMLGDIKTIGEQGSLWDTGLMQLAAYWMAYVEMYPSRPIDEARLIGLNRDTNDFIEARLEARDMPEAFRAFLGLFEAWKFETKWGERIATGRPNAPVMA